MGIRSFFCKLPLLAILWLAYPAYAAGGLTAVNHQDFNFKGQYEFTLDGLLFGRVGLEIKEKEGVYSVVRSPSHNVTLDVKSAGIINLFTKHSSHTTLDVYGMNCLRCEDLAPSTYLEYETHYLTKKKPRHVKLAYTGGIMTEEIVEPPEDPAKRPPVAPALKNSALDPLSFIFRIYDEAQQALLASHKTFSIPVYDGRRLTQANFTLLGKRRIDYAGKPTPVIALEVRRKPLAGFTAVELSDLDPHEPAAILYLSDDARLIPLKLEVGLWFGTAAATLVKECTSGESCLLGNNE